MQGDGVAHLKSFNGVWIHLHFFPPCFQRKTIFVTSCLLIWRTMISKMVSTLTGKNLLRWEQVAPMVANYFLYEMILINMVTGHVGPKPSRPLHTSAPSHLGPKPSRPHLKINSWTLRSLVMLAPSHLGPTALVTSAPV